MLALGSLAAVEQLADWLQRGPPRARVNAVEVSEDEADDHHTLADFRTG